MVTITMDYDGWGGSVRVKTSAIDLGARPTVMGSGAPTAPCDSALQCVRAMVNPVD